MEGLLRSTPFAEFAAPALRASHFTVIDVGCKGGIDEAWRLFGGRLSAFGFDPNVEEIARLRAAEALPGVQYIAGFVGVGADDPSYAMFDSGRFSSHSPWPRLAVARSLTIRRNRAAKSDGGQKIEAKTPRDIPPAPRDKPIVLPQFFSESGITDIDFVKIDVDGPDYLILRSLESCLKDKGVLGVGIEVNFFGSADPETSTFHNVDRFLRRAGFDLFALTTRKYSAAALPAPYRMHVPSRSDTGRPIQGDAVYFRDLAAPVCTEWAQSASGEKLLKLAIMFSLMNLPDCAAELLVKFADRLRGLVDVERALHCLIEQGPLRGRYASYQEYMAAFEADSPDFYLASSARPLDLERSLAALDKIYASTSWKITAPLRGAMKALRRIVPT